MRFACEQCQTKYSIPDERVRGKILKIRCKTCGCLISVSESGARTTSVGEPAADPGQSTAGLDMRDQLAGESGGGGGDATMIGGMADFFGKLPGAEPPADEWHLSVDGNQQGPIALSNLAQMILDQANTSAELYVWREGFDGWKPPEDVPEVKSALAKAKSAKPAPQPAAKPTPEPKKAAGKAAADSGKPAAKESPLGGAKGKEPAKAAAKPAAKPAVSASLASSDGDGGDAESAAAWAMVARLASGLRGRGIRRRVSHGGSAEDTRRAARRERGKARRPASVGARAVSSPGRWRPRRGPEPVAGRLGGGHNAYR